MIPRAHVTGWRGKAPWAFDDQVEQDLVICRALAEIFSHPQVASTMAFRGGTALHKLHFDRPGRYSEDIDLVQVVAGPIGEGVAAIRERLDPWLGAVKSKRSDFGVTLKYRFAAETQPVVWKRLKVEINTREHFSVLGLERVPFAVDSAWYRASATISSYRFEELLGTKLRALYQRRKGRDLFDLWVALSRTPPPNVGEIVHCFTEYIGRAGTKISRSDFERNLKEKRSHQGFLADIRPLLPAGSPDYDPVAALDLVQAKLISLIP